MLHDSASGSLGQSFVDRLGEHVSRSAPSPSAGETAAAFLRWLDPIGRHNIVRLDPDRKHVPLGRTFEPNEFEMIAAYVDEWAGKSNLYYSVNEPREHAPDKKLADTDMVRVRAIIADIDLPGANGPAEIAELRKSVDGRLKERNAPEPSYVIESGGGFQLGWLLPEKRAVTAVPTREALSRGVAIALDGDRSVVDTSRIMRLPGPINLPDAKKRAKGRVARQAVLLSQGEPCDVETLTAAIPPVADVNPAAANPRASEAPDADATIAAVQAELDNSDVLGVYSDRDWPPDLAGRFVEALTADRALAELWSGAPPKSDDHSGSAYRAALAGRIGRLGWSAEEYAMLARGWSHAVQAGDDIDAKLTPRALARDWVNCALPNHPDTIRAARAAIIVKFFEPFVTPAAGTPSAAGDRAAVMCGAASAGVEIVDLFGHADPGELGTPPAGSLPPVIERWVRTEAPRKGVSEAFAAMSAVTVAAAAIGNAFQIQPKQRDTGWTEPASLWAVVVAPPGSTKSAIIKEAARPLENLDARCRADWIQKQRAWAQADKAFRASQRKKDAPPEPNPGLEPECVRFVVDNFTMEKIVRISAANPKGLFGSADELAAFLGNIGAYKRSGDGDRAQVLRLFDGGRAQIDRVGNGSVFAESALLGVLASTQPDKVRTLADELSDDGLLQRFIFIMPDGRDRRDIDEAPDAAACEAYADIITRLAAIPYAKEARILLTPDASRIREEGFERIRALGSLFGYAEAFQGHVVKFGKFLARIILTFHCLDELERFGRIDTDRQVSAETATRAVAFAAFLARHSLAFYRQFVGLSDTASNAQWIAGYLLTRPDLTTVNTRTFYSAHKPFQGESGNRACKSALFELDRAGWLTKVPMDVAKGKDLWTVQSAIHSRFAEHAIRESARRLEAQGRIRAAVAARLWASGKSQTSAFE